MDLAVFHSKTTREIVSVAYEVAKSLGSGCVGSGHLALALFQSAPEHEVLTYLLATQGVKIEEANLYVRSVLESDPRGDKNNPQLSKNAKWALQVAGNESTGVGESMLSPESMLLGLVAPQKGAHVGEVLRPLGLELHTLRHEWRKLLDSQRQYPPDHPLAMLDDESKQVIQSAHEIARRNGSGRIATGHLLLALTENTVGKYWIEQAGVDIERLREVTLGLLVSDGETVESKHKFAPDARAALLRTRDLAANAGKISPRLLLVGLIAPQENTHKQGDVAAQVLEPYADELRIAAFVFQKRPSKQDWPWSLPLFAGFLAVQIAIGLWLTSTSPTILFPKWLIYFVPVVLTAVGSRLFRWETLHFNAVMAFLLSLVLLFMVLAYRQPNPPPEIEPDLRPTLYMISGQTNLNFFY